MYRHAITDLIHKKIYRVYIYFEQMKKNVKRKHTKVRINYDNWSIKPEAHRFDKMCDAFYEVADLGT